MGLPASSRDMFNMQWHFFDKTVYDQTLSGSNLNTGLAVGLIILGIFSNIFAYQVISFIPFLFHQEMEKLIPDY